MLTVKLTGYLPTHVELPNHPKNKNLGSRKMAIAPNIFVESIDFTDVKVGTRYTLIGLGNTVITDIMPLTLHYDKNDTEYKSTIKITWLPNDNSNILTTVKKYDHLLSKHKIEENDTITEIFNRDSYSKSVWLIEKAIQDIPMGQVVQIMRHGYCYVDKNDDDKVVLHLV